MAEPLSPRESILLRIQQLRKELSTLEECLCLIEQRDKERISSLSEIRSFDFRGMKAIHAVVEYLKAKGAPASVEELYVAMKSSHFEFNPKTPADRHRRVITIAASMNPLKVRYDEQNEMLSLAR
jgi:hypothetical protein